MTTIYRYFLVLFLQLAIFSGNGLYAQSAKDGTPKKQHPFPTLEGLDIGGVGEAGNTAINETTGQYTVSGSGGDIFGKNDQFHFAYTPWSGDGEIIARVLDVTNTHKSAKGGVMFRESLDNDSVNVVMEILASAGSEFQYREITGDKTSYKSTKGIKPPYFIRLIRRGNTFTGYRSADGSKWDLQSSVTVSMQKDVYVGLSVTAHNNEALNTVTFTNVKISSEISPEPKAPPTESVSAAPVNRQKGNTGVAGFIPLLNSRTFDPLTDDGQDPSSFQSDTDEFYTYRSYRGVNKGYDEDEGKSAEDDDVVFRLTPEGELHILGVPNTGQVEPFGYISTKDNYRNYHLSLEYKWGKEKFSPRGETVRDSGLLYHVLKPEDEVWTDSVETQIQENDTGDFHFLWGKGKAIGTVTATSDRKRYQPKGKLLKDHGSRLVKSETVDLLTDWNHVEVIVEQDEVTVVVNGVVVNRATDMRLNVEGKLIPLTEGKIQLQAEGAEIFYRNIKIKPVHAVGGRGKFKVLLFQEAVGEGRPNAEVARAAQEAIVNLGRTNGFTVDVANNSQGIFTDNNLKQYSTVIWNTSGDVLDAKEQVAFENFIKSGGGFVGLPNAASTETQWTWFRELVGGLAESHMPQNVMTVKVDPEASFGAGGSGLHHPAVDALPMKWKRHDALDNYRKNPRDEVNVLLAIAPELENQGDASIAKDDSPIAWWHDFDGGRSFFTGLGHSQQSYYEPLYQMHLLGGIEYAAGVSRVRPADAVVLFDGTNTDAFEQEKGGDIDWKIDEQGNLAIVHGQSYFVQTTESFTDYRLHLEFKIPTTKPGTPEQKRGNSGLYLHRSYELQLLDSYKIAKFDEHQLGSIYGVKEADANAALPADTWQVYEVDFTAPRFDATGEKTANARVTAYLNGVLIHDNIEIDGPTAVGKPEQPGPQPFMLQDHDPNSQIKFRNIWLQKTTTPSTNEKQQ